MAETVLAIANMKCGGCVASVEQALQSVEGVESATVSLEEASAVVMGAADIDALIKASTDAGFPATAK